MRLQLAWSGLHIIPPETFNRLFTMHGTTMVFLVGIPIVFGFGNYLVPLMIGARDLAFPRLNAFGFWVFLFGGLLLHFSFIGGDGLYGAGSAPAVGWFAYAPAHEPGLHARQCHGLLEPRGVRHRHRHHRHRGQPRDDDADDARARDDLGRMPVFVWIMLTVSGMTLLILPPLSAAQIMLRPRPLSRRALLRHPGGRLRGDVAALLLVLRPPRGLRPHAAGLRLRVGDHPRLLAQGHLRLRHAGGGGRVDRRGGAEHLGPSHVRGGPGRAAHVLLRGLDDADRRAHGDQDLQLAGDDVRRHARSSRRRCCSAAPSCSSSCARGSRASCSRWRPSTGSSRTPTSWWRTSTSCSSAGCSSRSSPPCTTGSRR